MADALKIDDNTIEVDEVTPAIPEKVVRQTYNRKFIEDQIKNITEQRDAQLAEITALKEAELKKCTDIILEMNKLGITTKVEE